MKLDFPLTPDSIREGIQEIVADVLEETKWELKRNPTKTKIKIGTAPEYGELFGVKRDKGKLAFGKWINDLEPEYVFEAILEFLIIREALAHFFTDDVLYGEMSSLTNIVLNIASMSYYQEIHKTKTINIKLSLFRRRLFSDKENTPEYIETYKKVNPLIISVLSENVIYNLIINSYLYFITDIDEFDFDDILDSLTRYLAKTPEEIIFPIYLKENSSNILANLTTLGYDSTLEDVASRVGVDESIVSKELKKFDSKFRAIWTIEKNWFKLGLHSCIVIIRFDKTLKKNRDKMIEFLKTNHYLSEIFIGENDEYTFVYSVFHTSHFISEHLAARLARFKNEGSITSFLLNSITERIFTTSLLYEKHPPTLATYKKLLSGVIPYKNLQLWSSNNFDDKTAISFDIKDKTLLRFLTFFRKKSITSYDLFSVFLTGFNEFLEENNINPNNMTESVAFFKNNENQAKKRKLIDYRLSITVSDLNYVDSLVIKINLNPDEELSLKIMNKFAIFSSSILKSYTEFYIIIPGLTFDHFLTDLIRDQLKQDNIEYEIFPIKSTFVRNIGYHKLYDFNSKKWALTPLY
ncbi:MAG: hypothetical protein ACTSO7_05100 [Candidatus Heimdallarchaeota archaeon]